MTAGLAHLLPLLWCILTGVDKGKAIHTCAPRQHQDKMILLLYMLERVHVWVYACTCTCVEAKRQSWVLFSGGRSTSLKQGLSVFWRSPTRLNWPVNPRVPPVCLQMLGLQACTTTQTQVHTPGRQMLRHPRKVDILGL